MIFLGKGAVVSASGQGNEQAGRWEEGEREVELEVTESKFWNERGGSDCRALLPVSAERGLCDTRWAFLNLTPEPPTLVFCFPAFVLLPAIFLAVFLSLCGCTSQRPPPFVWSQCPSTS